MDRPAPPPEAPEADVIDPIEYEQRRIALRRRAAERSRRRRVAA